MVVGGGRDEPLAIRGRRMALRHPHGSRERLIILELVAALEDRSELVQKSGTDLDVEGVMNFLESVEVKLVPWQRDRLLAL